MNRLIEQYTTVSSKRESEENDGRLQEDGVPLPKQAKEMTTMDDLTYNASHAADSTAKKAIKAAVKPPEKVQRFIKFVKYIANWDKLEIIGRISIKDKETGITYK
ncbi:MAG: hypothetical protein LUF92_17210 [Clostridiales bacterium]|nr:hypothetical protein [Clostridiales bacterium]